MCGVQVAGEGQGDVGGALVRAVHDTLLAKELAPTILTAADLLTTSKDAHLINTHPEQGENGARVWKLLY